MSLNEHNAAKKLLRCFLIEQGPCVVQRDLFVRFMPWVPLLAKTGWVHKGDYYFKYIYYTV